MNRSLTPVLAAFILLALVAQPLQAGGASVSVRVLAVSASSKGRHIVRVEPLASNPSVFPEACAAITLTVTYRPSRWWRSTGTPSSPFEHAEALKLLSDAEKSGTQINFGVMGQGLSPSHESPCHLLSNGLQVTSESSGASAVYSFFKWP